MNQSSFSNVRAGDPITAADENAVREVVRALAGTIPGGESFGAKLGPVGLFGTAPGTVGIVARIRTDLLYPKNPDLDWDTEQLRRSRAADPDVGDTGVVADVMVWNRTLRRYVATDTRVLVECEANQFSAGGPRYYGLEMPIDEGQLVYLSYNPSSGKYIPLTTFQVRHAKTAPVDGSYPLESERPTVYGVWWVNTKYREEQGRQTLTSFRKTAREWWEPSGSGDVVPDSADPSGSEESGSGSGESGRIPDAFVYNMTGSYLPEGTLIWCYFFQGQWWSWMGGTSEPESGSGSGDSGDSGSGSGSGDGITIEVVTKVCPIYAGEGSGDSSGMAFPQMSAARLLTLVRESGVPAAAAIGRRSDPGTPGSVPFRRRGVRRPLADVPEPSGESGSGSEAGSDSGGSGESGESGSGSGDSGSGSGTPSGSGSGLSGSGDDCPIAGIDVWFQSVTFPPGWTVSPPVCYDVMLDCCGGGSLGAGSALGGIPSGFASGGGLCIVGLRAEVVTLTGPGTLGDPHCDDPCDESVETTCSETVVKKRLYATIDYDAAAAGGCGGCYGVVTFLLEWDGTSGWAGTMPCVPDPYVPLYPGGSVPVYFFCQSDSWFFQGPSCGLKGSVAALDVSYDPFDTGDVLLVNVPPCAPTTCDGTLAVRITDRPPPTDVPPDFLIGVRNERRSLSIPGGVLGESRSARSPRDCCFPTDDVDFCPGFWGGNMTGPSVLYLTIVAVVDPFTAGCNEFVGLGCILFWDAAQSCYVGGFTGPSGDLFEFVFSCNPGIGENGMVLGTDTNGFGNEECSAYCTTSPFYWESGTFTEHPQISNAINACPFGTRIHVIITETPP